jgi:hypothetical protein
MKKIALSTLFLVTSIFATEVDLQKNMIKMENGVSNIQRGFLYNNIDLIKNGIEEISTANHMFASKDVASKYLPKEKKHMSNVAFNSAKKIDFALEELKVYLDKKELTSAHKAYSEVIDSCTVCHSIVRSW